MTDPGSQRAFDLDKPADVVAHGPERERIHASDFVVNGVGRWLDVGVCGRTLAGVDSVGRM